MRYLFDVSKIKPVDLAVIGAIDSIHSDQSHNCIVSMIDKDGYHFELKSTLNEMQMTRLFVDRVKTNLPGYAGKIYTENGKKYMVVSRVNK